MTVAGVVEAVYTFGVRRTYYVAGVELVRLQTVEGIALAIGLFALLCSLARY